MRDEGSGGRPRTPEAKAVADRAASRWARLDGSDSGSESDPEEELEQLRKQVRSRVKAAAWGRGQGIGVAALERRLLGEDDDDD